MESISEKVTPKIMNINAGKRNSLHYHNNKDEFVYCISGVGTLQRDMELLPLKPETFQIVPRHVVHRVKAEEELKLLEISLGDYDENDIVRFEDDYGRVI